MKRLNTLLILVAGCAPGFNPDLTDLGEELGTSETETATAESDESPDTSADSESDESDNPGESDTTEEGESEDTTDGESLCGNGIVEETEECDVQAGNVMCQHFGFQLGTVGCWGSGCWFTISGCQEPWPNELWDSCVGEEPGFCNPLNSLTCYDDLFCTRDCDDVSDCGPNEGEPIDDPQILVGTTLICGSQAGGKQTQLGDGQCFLSCDLEGQYCPIGMSCVDGGGQAGLGWICV
jgi:hypothetical protein